MNRSLSLVGVVVESGDKQEGPDVLSNGSLKKLDRRAARFGLSEGADQILVKSNWDGLRPDLASVQLDRR